MSSIDEMPARPSAPDTQMASVIESVVEWRAAKRGVLEAEYVERSGLSRVEHGFDARGTLVAERSAAGPGELIYLEHRDEHVVAHLTRGDGWTPYALLVPHRGALRLVARWPMWSATAPPTRWTYVDGQHGVERATLHEPSGEALEVHYERDAAGTLVRVVQHDVNGTMLLWPVPNAAESKRAVAKIAELRAPLGRRLQELSSTSEGFAVLSYGYDSFLPPVLSWLNAGEPSQDLMVGEWRHTDLGYLRPEEAEEWVALNDAVARKPRATAKALVDLARALRTELATQGLVAYVVALPLEVETRQEKLLKGQLTRDEQDVLRRWGIMR